MKSREKNPDIDGPGYLCGLRSLNRFHITRGNVLTDSHS